MSIRDNRIGGSNVGTEVYAAINDVEKRFQAALDAQNVPIGVDLPEVDSSFSPLFEGFKKGFKVTLAYFIPGYVAALKTIVVDRDEMVDQDAYEHSRIKNTFDDISDSDREAGRIERRFEEYLEPNHTYDVIRLNAIDFNGNAHYNPEEEPDFASYPGNVLFTFTTPASTANPPSKPTLARIIDNNDDQVVLRIFADETEVLTFAAQGQDAIQPLVLKDADNDVKIKPYTKVEDASLTFQDIQIPVGDPENGHLKVGNTYIWPSNRAWAGDDFAEAPATSTVAFVAGGYADPDDGVDEDHGMVNLTCSFNFDNSPPYSSTLVHVIATVTQPATPYRQRHARFYIKKTADSDSTYYQVGDTIPLQAPEFNTASTAYDLVIDITTGVNKNYTIKLVVTSVRDPNGIDHSFTGTYSSGGATAAATESASGGDRSLIVGASFQASVDDETVANGGASVPADQKYPMRDWETTANSGTRINNTATGGGGATIDSKGIQWRNTEGRLKLTTSLVTLGGKPAVKLGKLFKANDVCAVCASFKSDSAAITPTISFALVDQTAGDMVVATAVSFPVSNTSEQRGIWILVVPNSYAGTAKQWLELRLSANPAQNLYTWNWQLSFGVLYRDFKVNDEEQAVLDFLDVTPLTTKSYFTDVMVVGDEGEEYKIGGTLAGPISVA